MTSLVVLSCLAWTLDGPQSPAAPQPPGPAAGRLVAALETAMADAIAKAEPSVVAIHRDKGENSQETRAVRGRKPPPRFQEPSQLDFRPDRPADLDDFISFDFGSGVVIGDQGQILTAFHVVRGAARLRVRAAGGTAVRGRGHRRRPAQRPGRHRPGAIPGVEPPRLKPLAIGDASRLRKGSFLIALGNPFNAARRTAARRRAGASCRTSPAGWMARRGQRWSDGSSSTIPTLLQLDAKLNLGMSGGAVINLKGELVGLTTTAASPAGFDAQAGYAIPMDQLGPPRRRDAQGRQGSRVRAARHRSRRPTGPTGSARSPATRRPRWGISRSTTRSSPSTIRPSLTSTR